jgi:leucyl-tRNA synthetase
VPAHDERDWQFAKKYKIEIIPVIRPLKGDLPAGRQDWDFKKEPFLDTDNAKVFNSGFLDGLTALKAKEKIISYLVKKGWGKRAKNYHLHDWIFSRQHYWGEPIPIIHCPKCGMVPVPEKDLPVELPKVEKYQPTDTGESPLAKITDWVNTKCPRCGGPAKRETDTMPNWAGSSWYYLSFCFANELKNPKHEILNSKHPKVEQSSLQGNPDTDFQSGSGQITNSNSPNLKPVSNLDIRNSDLPNIFTENINTLAYWLPVDIYVGGAEHTTLHLLYSRFWHKFLNDIGLVPGKEPYTARRQHGVILGEDGCRMSKSRGNVINPDDVVTKFGADTLRVYLMFMGPYDSTMPWNTKGLEGSFRFLSRIWRLYQSRNCGTKISKKTSDNLAPGLAKLIKKVGSDIELLKHNTAIAAMMEFLNAWTAGPPTGGLSKADAGNFLKILAPFAPFMAEEIWSQVLKNKGSVHAQSWPKFDPELIKDEQVTIIVQVNGKLRGQIEVQSEICNSQSEIEKLAEKEPKIAKYLISQKIKKVIFVPGRLINFVI